MAWKRQCNHTRPETSRENISVCVCGGGGGSAERHLCGHRHKHTPYLCKLWILVFSFLVFMAHALRTSHLGHKRKEKNSVHNLPYRPHTRLIRGMYSTYNIHVQGSKFISLTLGQNFAPVHSKFF